MDLWNPTDVLLLKIASGNPGPGYYFPKCMGHTVWPILYVSVFQTRKNLKIFVRF